ncbi:hypothetical protein F4825DRAFT_383617 [Nemania diffusa]|nr:hypothetical protein F4825DRAFT_383617 [Nemania diffusa]
MNEIFRFCCANLTLYVCQIYNWNHMDGFAMLLSFFSLLLPPSPCLHAHIWRMCTDIGDMDVYPSTQHHDRASPPLFPIFPDVPDIPEIPEVFCCIEDLPEPLHARGRNSQCLPVLWAMRVRVCVRVYPSVCSRRTRKQGALGALTLHTHLLTCPRADDGCVLFWISGFFSFSTCTVLYLAGVLAV